MPRGKKPVDLTGKRFGEFVAIRPTTRKDKKNSVVWECRCDCGQTFERAAQRIVHGSISCGCRQMNNSGQHEAIDLHGKILRDIEYVEQTKKRTSDGYTIWHCRCLICNRQFTRDSRAYTTEKVSCRCKGWYEKYLPDCRRGRQKMPGDKSLYNSHWGSYKRSAVRRNIHFDLNREQFDEMIKANCHYCGISPESREINKNISPGILTANGVDRIDSSKGYTADNCVPCCKQCNYAKSNMDQSQFLQWIKRVHDHSFS